MYWPHFSEVKAKDWRWHYFTPRELASKGDGSLLIDPVAVDMLEEMRDIVGRPFIITSAYRDPLHNARVGGSPRSMHKQGKAFDIARRGHDRDELLEAAYDAGFTGIGRYNTFLHVDNGRKRDWGKWD